MCINISLSPLQQQQQQQHFHCVGDLVGEGREGIADVKRSALASDPFPRARIRELEGHAHSHSGTCSGRAAGPKLGLPGPARSPAEFF